MKPATKYPHVKEIPEGKPYAGFYKVEGKEYLGVFSTKGACIQALKRLAAKLEKL